MKRKFLAMFMVLSLMMSTPIISNAEGNENERSVEPRAVSVRMVNDVFNNAYRVTGTSLANGNVGQAATGFRISSCPSGNWEAAEALEKICRVNSSVSMQNGGVDTIFSESSCYNRQGDTGATKVFPSMLVSINSVHFFECNGARAQFLSME